MNGGREGDELLDEPLDVQLQASGGAQEQVEEGTPVDVERRAPAVQAPPVEVEPGDQQSFVESSTGVALEAVDGDEQASKKKKKKKKKRKKRTLVIATQGDGKRRRGDLFLCKHGCGYTYTRKSGAKNNRHARDAFDYHETQGCQMLPRLLCPLGCQRRGRLISFGGIKALRNHYKSKTHRDQMAAQNVTEMAPLSSRAGPPPSIPIIQPILNERPSKRSRRASVKSERGASETGAVKVEEGESDRASEAKRLRKEDKAERRMRRQMKREQKAKRAKARMKRRLDSSAAVRAGNVENVGGGDQSEYDDGGDIDDEDDDDAVMQFEEENEGGALPPRKSAGLKDLFAQMTNEAALLDKLAVKRESESDEDEEEEEVQEKPHRKKKKN